MIDRVQVVIQRDRRLVSFAIVALTDQQAMLVEMAVKNAVTACLTLPSDATAAEPTGLTATDSN